MNREIKFRAWDKRDKKFIAEGFSVIGETTMFGVIEQYCYDNMGDAKTLLHRLGDIVISQFTGLKDKNGKDIYEGDIVSAWSQGYNHKGEIRWRLTGAPMIIIYPAFANQGFWSLHGVEHGEGKTFIGIDAKIEFSKGEKRIVDDGAEVIGNIFDNPEYLQP